MPKEQLGHIPEDQEDCIWWKSAPPGPEAVPLEEDIECDVAIVGGGYTGLSTAIELARKGIDCVVLEARFIGFGASGRNAGHCTPTFHLTSPDKLRQRLGREKADQLTRLQVSGADRVFSLIEKYQISCEAKRNGYLRIAHGPHRLDELRQKKSLYEGFGLEGELLDAKSAQDLSGSPRAYGGWLLKQGGHLNPTAYARGLARAAIQEGARLYQETPLLELNRTGKSWELRTPQGRVRANQALLATGAYAVGPASALLKGATHPVPIMGFASEPLPSELRQSILPDDQTLVDTHKDPILYKWTDDHRLVTTVYPAGRVGREPEPTARWLEARTKWMFPQIETVTFRHPWSGRLDVQPLTLPQVHNLEEGLWACVGFSGRGVPTASAAGVELARLLEGASSDEIALPVRQGVNKISGRLASLHPVVMTWNRTKDWLADRLHGGEAFR
ncbi:NAD(P)/FAD-dependent oxidoreductase [Fodinicurvata sediminis]|uniref:NAD(P)/FAD-dependent oxidoreductase n=1 Tax=Fodinicurvata sediminis TaxID=1121832 RepID=UPI0003B7A1D3|nr:FAD-dependent oxidoreductase [Fodinicurvata sediminis]